MKPIEGTGLDAKDGARLSVASAEEREKIIASIVRKMHRRRREANATKNRRHIAKAPELLPA